MMIGLTANWMKEGAQVNNSRRDTADGLTKVLERSVADRSEEPVEKSLHRSVTRKIRRSVRGSRAKACISTASLAHGSSDASSMKRPLSSSCCQKAVCQNRMSYAFDTFDAEFTHEGDQCSFDVLMTGAGPALRDG